MSSNEKKSDTGHHPKKRSIFLTIGSIVIFVLAAISFIFLPAMAGDSSQGNKLPPFGKYMGKPIAYEQGTPFTRMVEFYYRQAEAYGQQVDDSMFFQIFSTSFNAAVINLAFTDEVEKSGYVLPTTLVDRTIIQLPNFIDPETGEYSPRLYAQLNATTKNDLRTEISDSLMQQRYASDFFGDQVTGRYGIKQSSKEIPFVDTMGKTKRAIDFITFSLEEYPDAEKIAYGSENADLFAKYDVSVITLDSESAASKLKSQIDSNEVTFEDGISQFSNNAYSSTDGKISDPYYYNIKTIIPAQEDLDALATLTPGDISNVIPTATGFSIFMCNWAPAAADFSDAVTLETVFSYMKDNEAGKIEDYFIAQANDFSSQAVISGFDSAARNYGLEKQTTPAFNLNYGSNTLLTAVSTEGEYAALYGAGTNEKFLSTVFSLRENEVSSPMLIGSNVIVFQVADIIEEEDNENLQYLYTSATQEFDTASMQAYFFDESRLENNFFSVYFQNFLNN